MDRKLPVHDFTAIRMKESGSRVGQRAFNYSRKVCIFKKILFIYRPKLFIASVVNYIKTAKKFNYLNLYTNINVVELPASYCKMYLNK